MEELVAELGSAFLSADLDLMPELRGDHASYIASWIKVLGLKG
jgi:antirestriction protein ArdC